MKTLKKPLLADPLPITEIYLPPIAYELASYRIDPFLEPKIDIENYQLIGLQLEFREQVANNQNIYPLLPQLLLSQVYFYIGNSKPEEGNSYFLRVLDEEESIIKLSEIRVITESNISDRSSFDLVGIVDYLGGNFNQFNDFSYLQRKLDFYSSSIGAVYFPIGSFRYMTQFYDTLVFSGAQINLGKKLSTDDSTEKEGDFTEPYFSMKLEGRYPITSRTLETGVVDGPDVILGHPCPPKWKSFLKIIDPFIVNSDDADRLLTNLSVVFNDWQVLVSTYWPVINLEN